MSITKTLRDRLVAEAEEAETQGLVKIAENLTLQIERNEVREDSEPYKYTGERFQQDVETALWDIITKASDFYDKHIPASEAQKIVASVASNIMSEIRIVANVKHGVGAHEPPVPGEVKERVEFDVYDD
jgi:hypothetical protein